MTLESQPPRSPLLEVVTTSKESITLRWDINELDIEEKELILHYKEENSLEWRQKKIKTKHNHVVLDSSDGETQIRCGTKYKLFMTAINSLGSGEPSNSSNSIFIMLSLELKIFFLAGETIITKTKGSAPVSPSKEDFIFPNATSVALKLSRWQTDMPDTCPINLFTIKYKPIHHKQSPIILYERPNSEYEPYYYLHNLVPGRDYELFVRADSDAGKCHFWKNLFATIILIISHFHKLTDYGTVKMLFKFVMMN